MEEEVKIEVKAPATKISVVAKPVEEEVKTSPVTIITKETNDTIQDDWNVVETRQRK